MGEVSPLNRLYAQYRDKGFEFLTIYVREPHPGENYPAHQSWEQKLQYARDCRAQDGIARPRNGSRSAIRTCISCCPMGPAITAIP